MRWDILEALNQIAPDWIREDVLSRALEKSHLLPPGANIRRELDYLEQKQFILIDKEAGAQWLLKLSATGIDYLEYSAPEIMGIDRPRLAQE